MVVNLNEGVLMKEEHPYQFFESYKSKHKLPLYPNVRMITKVIIR